MNATKVKPLLCVLATLFLTTSCSAPKAAAPPWPKSELDLAPSAEYVKGLIDACRQEPTRSCRDRTVDAAQAHLDDLYYQAKKAYLGSNGGGGSRDRWWQSIPVLNLIFATASSRESQTSKVADMSAATAVLNGLRAIFRRPEDKYNILKDKKVLVAQMEKDRAAISTEIALQVTRPVEQYTLEDALADLGRYRDAGTPDVAKIELAKLLGI